MARMKQLRQGVWSDVDVHQKRNGAIEKVQVNQRQGGSWTSLTTQKYTKTWEANWTQAYSESGAKRTDYRGSKLCQGRYASDPWGILRSLAGFPDMATELAGAKILDVKIYLHNEHWYYSAGGKAVIGYHSHGSEPTSFSHTKSEAKVESYSAREQAKWIDMPIAFGEGIRDGIYKGFSLYKNSQSLDYYGIFYGAGDGSKKPKIKITYEK
ncbi:hypothetical protein [Peribacillus asahii]|uniref:hypothetical protein n=1 Tax=Peribacillus asahii TaxID=228899 RepID=UPI00381C6772